MKRSTRAVSLLARMLALCAGLGALAAAGASEQPKRRLEAGDFNRLQSVASPACSGDGQWVAYTVTSADTQADEARTAVWLVNWRGGQSVRLTGAGGSATRPQFSPDGRYVSFLSADAPQANAQLYLVDRGGGEARALTAFGGEIDAYQWSPDGKRIVISATPAEETAAGAKGPRPIVIDRLHFKQDEKGYLTAASRAQLALLDVATGRVVALTSDARFDDRRPVWSPDGTRIAYVSSHETDPDRSGLQELYVIEARAGATAQRLAQFWAPNDFGAPYLQTLLWSADGKQIAYLVGREPRLYAYMQDRLAIVAASGGAPRVLTERLDRAVSVPVQMPAAAGAAIGVLVDDDRVRLPALVRADDGSVTPLLQGRYTVLDQCAAAGHLALLVSTDQGPPELYALESGQLRRLSAHNDALMAQIELGSVDEISFASSDGTEVRGLLVKPPDYQPGRRYPTLLWIHGGPNFNQDKHALVFDSYPIELERQWFAAHGYVVLAVNYRGSSGRGLAYASSIAGDWGNKEVADLLAAVDYAVREKIADPQRLGIGGWSYGGLLTDYAIASDTRFGAAVSGAGSANQLSIYGADQYILQYNAELGAPWVDPGRWIRVSYPFFHADRIRTPTLFLGAERDFDVPVSGAEQMYAALRTLGVPTQLVVYPDQFHDLTRPSFVRDRIERYLDWFDRYLKPIDRP